MLMLKPKSYNKKRLSKLINKFHLISKMKSLNVLKISYMFFWEEHKKNSNSEMLDYTSDLEKYNR